ncbi:MAG: cytochrome c oxidase assembly protein [Proteobacteria bacterium]|nr:cytochrome c oxidase assembly protein [Pseudomonadota bacterium]
MPLNKNTRLLFVLIAIIIAMGCFTAAMVPLYRVFCQHFGIAIPSVAVQSTAVVPTQVSNRTVTVRFTANTNTGVPIQFTPVAYNLKVHLGEPVFTAYQAENLSSKPINGIAIHMLYGMGGDPDIDITPYVELQQCFCFEQQHYPAQKTVRLPLYFTISPDLPEGVHTITFSYTLFEALPGDPRIKKKAP